MFVGRKPDLVELLGVAERASAGQGGGRWLVGDAGVGKTALLRELVERVDPGIRVLWATGREGEVDLAWGVFEQLLGPLVAEDLDASLPVPQRAAVRAALAVDADASPADSSPLAPAVGGRSILLAAAEITPVLVVVDDLHWVDQSSRRWLDYVLARTEGTSLGFVLAGRPGDDTDPPVPAQPVDPLDHDAALALLRDQGVADAAVGERILEQLGGSPLLLHAAATELDEHQRSGRAPLPEVLSVPASVTRLAERSLDALDDATRDAVLVSAIAPRGDLRTVTGALHGLGRDEEALVVAEAADIIRLDDGRIAFTHPTLRSAAYHLASPADRRRAHRAVAEAVDDDVLAAWHAGQAAVGPDDAVAGALTRAADILLRRRAPVAAARHLERAAALTRETGRAATWLRHAADALALTGRSEPALALLDHADALGGGELEAARRHQLRLRVAARKGVTDTVIEDMRSLAARVEALDPRLSSEILLDTLPALVRTFRTREIEQVAKDALELATRAGSSDLARRAEVVLGGVRLSRSELEGQVHLDRYIDVLEIEGPIVAATFLAEVAGPFLGVLRRGPEVDALFDTLDRDLREAVAIPALITVLAARAMVTHGRDLRLTIAYDTEAIELSDAIGQPELAVPAAVSLGIAAAVRGDGHLVSLAGDRCGDSADRPHPAARSAHALLRLGRGELDEALAIYEEMYERFGVGSSLVRWEPDWCEALVRTRQPARAAAMLAEFAASPVGPLATGQVARVRGMLADGEDAAADHFTHALRFVDLIPNDVVRGRTELLWGERLRRSRKRAEARTHLEQAVTVLRRVGADVWAERAERELIAAGAAPVAAQGQAGALTNQERDVVRLAVAGASNRAIADQMFLSPRTVETHLGSAYRKLGVRNRRELMVWASEGERLDD